MLIIDHPSEFAQPKHRQPRLVTPGVTLAETGQTMTLAEMEELERLARLGKATEAAAAERSQTPTDLEYLADSLDRLKHRDQSKFLKEVWGDAAPKDVNELSDRVDAWIVANLKEKAA